VRYALLAFAFLLPSRPLSAQATSALGRQWDSIVSRLPADAHDVARVLNEVYRTGGLPLVYWPKRDLPDSALRDLDVSDGPCGATVLAQSVTIPPRDNRLIGEQVFELDSAGRVLRRWTVPANSDPLVLREQALWVYLNIPNRSNLALAVTPDGHYSVVPVEVAAQGQETECPPHSMFPNSGYAKCLAFSGGIPRKRVIIYEAPCT